MGVNNAENDFEIPPLERRTIFAICSRVFVFLSQSVSPTHHLNGGDVVWSWVNSAPVIHSLLLAFDISQSFSGCLRLSLSNSDAILYSLRPVSFVIPIRWVLGEYIAINSCGLVWRLYLMQESNFDMLFKSRRITLDFIKSLSIIYLHIRVFIYLLLSHRRTPQGFAADDMQIFGRWNISLNPSN